MSLWSGAPEYRLPETICILCRHILLCLNLPYPALHPVSVRYQSKETQPLNQRTLCLSSYRFNPSVSSLLSLFPLTLVPTVHYAPTSSTFSSCHSFILLIPLSPFHCVSHSCLACLVSWLSSSFSPTTIYPLSRLAVSHTVSLPSVFSALSFFLFSWKLEKVPGRWVEGSSQQRVLALECGPLKGSTERPRLSAETGKSSGGSWQTHTPRPWTCAVVWSTMRGTGHGRKPSCWRGSTWRGGSGTASWKICRGK